MQRLCLQPSENPSRNVTFSPLNVSIALTFLLLGAHSTPLTEILGGLKFSLTATPKADIRRGFRHLPRSLRPPSCSLHLSRGSAMFMDEQLKLLGEFGMTVRQGDVRPPPSPSPPTSAITPLLRSSSMTVKEKPRGNTVELVNHADPNAAMVLVNYIFLEGECLAWGSERNELHFRALRLLLSWPSHLCRGGCPPPFGGGRGEHGRQGPALPVGTVFFWGFPNNSLSSQDITSEEPIHPLSEPEWHFFS